MTALTIGNFDGVHRGHRSLIEKILEHKRLNPKLDIQTVVITFDPHPIEILRPNFSVKKLSSTTDKIKLLHSLGVDHVQVIPFTKEFSQMPAREFFEKILIESHNPSLIAVGHNFFFGHNREGTPDKITQWSQELSIPSEIVGPIGADGEIISSSRIRQLIQEGSLIKASRLLGRDYSISSDVIHGHKRGTQIGIPTANLSLPPDRCLPKNGVYLSTCTLHDHGNTFPSITNVGVKPTFEASSPTISIETHLLDFNGDLYGKHITVEFRDRLRDEMRFASVDLLIQQIHKDIALARSRLGMN